MGDMATVHKSEKIITISGIRRNTLFLERCCSYICEEATYYQWKSLARPRRQVLPGRPRHTGGHSGTPRAALPCSHWILGGKQFNCRIWPLFLTYVQSGCSHSRLIQTTCKLTGHRISLEPVVGTGLIQRLFQQWVFSEPQETTLAPTCRRFPELLGFPQYLFHPQLWCCSLTLPHFMSIFSWQPHSPFSSGNNLQSLFLSRATPYRELYPMETLWCPYYREMAAEVESLGLQLGWAGM